VRCKYRETACDLLARVEKLLASAPRGHGLRVDGLLVALDGKDVWFDTPATRG
jgi:hypothetical protein